MKIRKFTIVLFIILALTTTVWARTAVQIDDLGLITGPTSFGRYTSLNTIVDDVGATNITITINRTINANTVVVPANLKLDFKSNGFLLPAAGQVVTFDSFDQIISPKRQHIFSTPGAGVGTIVSTNGGTAYPQRWGARGDGATLNTVALQAWLDSTADLVLPDGVYNFNATINWTGNNKTITSGRGAFLNWVGGNTDEAFVIGDGNVTNTDRVVINSLRMIDNSPSGVDRLLYFNGANYGSYNDLYLASNITADNGVMLTNAGWGNTYNATRIFKGYTGLELRTNSNAVTFYDFDANNLEKHGILRQEGQGGSVINFYGGAVESMNSGSGFGILIEAPVHSFSIDGMYFEANDQHIQVGGAGAFGQKFTITNSRFITGGGTASIEIVDAQAVYAERNEFRNTPLVYLSDADASYFGTFNISSDGQTEIEATSHGSSLAQNWTFSAAKGLKFNDHKVPEIEIGTTAALVDNASETVTFDVEFSGTPTVVATGSAAGDADGMILTSAPSSTQVTIHNRSGTTMSIKWTAMYVIP